METWQAVLLGLIQGLTEFLPVSSSGHLLLTREILGIEGNYLLFDILLHLATLIAVCAVLYKDILSLFIVKVEAEGEEERAKYKFKLSKRLLLLVIASVPAALLGVLAKLFGGEFFNNGQYLCFFFLITAALLLLAELLGKKLAIKPLSTKTAVIMGITQGAAILPGISRSGATISAGLLSGASREEVARFSFLMSLPIILGSLFVELLSIGEESATISPLPVLLGMIVALASGYLAIRVMLKLIQNANFKYFSAYLLILSIIVFINYYIQPIW